MIDPERPTEDLGAVEVVDGEDGRSLIQVRQEGESTGFARVFVAGHVDVSDFAVSDESSSGQEWRTRRGWEEDEGETGRSDVLREERDDVALSQIERQTAGKYDGRV